MGEWSCQMRVAMTARRKFSAMNLLWQEESLAISELSMAFRLGTKINAQHMLNLELFSLTAGKERQRFPCMNIPQCYLSTSLTKLLFWKAALQNPQTLD